MPNPNNKLPGQPTKAQVVAFEVLLGEREYQVETHGDSPMPTLADFANLLIEYTDKLAVDVTVDPTCSSPAGGPLKRLREIAAIALHGMEIYGIQPRENHVPASAGITGVLKVVGKLDSTAPKPAAPATSASAPVAQPAAPPPAAPAVAEQRSAPPPPVPHTDAPPVPAAHTGPVVTHHEAVELPHNPVTGEHGKK